MHFRCYLLERLLLSDSSSLLKHLGRWIIRFNPSNNVGSLVFVERCSRIVVRVNVATHNQEWVVHVDGALPRPYQALHAVLLELFIYILLATNLESPSRHLWMLDPLVFTVNHLIHRHWIYRQGTLLMK